MHSQTKALLRFPHTLRGEVNNLPCPYVSCVLSYSPSHSPVALLVRDSVIDAAGEFGGCRGKHSVPLSNDCFIATHLRAGYFRSGSRASSPLRLRASFPILVRAT